MTGFELDEYNELDSNLYINESSNIFNICLFSTIADFICDNHVKLTHLLSSSALLAQNRKIDFMPIIAFI